MIRPYRAHMSDTLLKALVYLKCNVNMLFDYCCLGVTLRVGTTYYDYGWTVIRLRHPDPAGFPLTGEIRLRPDCMFHSGLDFDELQYPVLHQVRCHCAINSSYQPRKSADEACRLMQPAAGSVLWRQLQPPIRFPARPLPAARQLCPRFIPLMQETMLPHPVLTLHASQKYANRIDLSIFST